MAGIEAKTAVSVNPKESGEGQARKKKKKNAPDRPQPAWLFPPDEENPVLNPKEKSQEQIDREIKERLEAIKFLKHKAVTAPVKPAPPTMLLTLIGAFLASYGFNSTGRIFSLERNARNKLDGWKDKIGAEIPKSMPDLVKIYKQWYKDWQDTKEDDDSDEGMVDADADANPDRKASQRKATGPVDDTSSSGSESESSGSGGAKLNGKRKTSKASSSSSSSESDADDEKGVIKASSPQPQVERFGKGLKRKTIEDAAKSSSESDSDFYSDSDRAARVKKKQKKAKEAEDPKKKTANENGMPIEKKLDPRPASDAKATPVVNEEPESSSSSESSSSQDSDVDTKMKDVSAPNLTTIPPPTDRTSSADSSTTMNAASPTKVAAAEVRAPSASSSTSASSSSASSSPPSPPSKKAVKSKKVSKQTHSASPAPTATTQTNGKNTNHTIVTESNPEPVAKPTKRSKHDKAVSKSGVPFQRIPENQVIDPRLASNAYVPNDYAHKAHEDLSITRGKGFTKEKNKKRRGAYRGGAIDVEGGKGVKFTD